MNVEAFKIMSAGQKCTTNQKLFHVHRSDKVLSSLANMISRKWDMKTRGSYVCPMNVTYALSFSQCAWRISFTKRKVSRGGLEKAEVSVGDI